MKDNQDAIFTTGEHEHESLVGNLEIPGSRQEEFSQNIQHNIPGVTLVPADRSGITTGELDQHLNFEDERKTVEGKTAKELVSDVIATAAEASREEPQYYTETTLQLHPEATESKFELEHPRVEQGLLEQSDSPREMTTNTLGTTEESPLHLKTKQESHAEEVSGIYLKEEEHAAEEKHELPAAKQGFEQEKPVYSKEEQEGTQLVTGKVSLINQ